jgi:hypothetical protein
MNQDSHAAHLIAEVVRKHSTAAESLVGAARVGGT